jgi:hypothetical protein
MHLDRPLQALRVAWLAEFGLTRMSNTPESPHPPAFSAD